MSPFMPAAGVFLRPNQDQMVCLWLSVSVARRTTIFFIVRALGPRSTALSPLIGGGRGNMLTAQETRCGRFEGTRGERRTLRAELTRVAAARYVHLITTINHDPFPRFSPAPDSKKRTLRFITEQTIGSDFLLAERRRRLRAMAHL